MLAANIILGLSSAGGGVEAFIAEALSKYGTVAAAALFAAEPIIHDQIENNNAVKNLCLGITVPKQGLGTFMNRIAALMGWRLLEAFRQLGPNDLKAWLESCPGAPPAAPQSSAPAASAGNQPVAPVPPTVPPVAPATTQPPAPTDHDVDMTDACRTQYGDSSLGAQYENWNDPDSWVCVNSSGAAIGGISVQGWCDTNFPGSTAVTVDNTAYGWRCQE